MLAVFEDGGEVLICEVDSEGKPITNGYFKKETGRKKDEMDLTLVEAPIMITRGPMGIAAARELT